MDTTLLEGFTKAFGGSFVGVLVGWVVIRVLDSNLKRLFDINLEQTKADLQSAIEILKSDLQKQSKEIEILLQRKSNFEEKLILDRYELARDIETKIIRIATDLNRLKHGIAVPGLIVGTDIVPLTNVFELIAAHRYLLTDKFVRILTEQAQLVMAMAKRDDLSEEMRRSYGKLQDDFKTAMNEDFSIDKIKW